MQPTSSDLLRRLARARRIEFRPERLPRAGWLRTAGGVRLHYLDWPGEGDTLVLLHGGSLSAHSFDLLALALAPDIRCVALDLRGHGLSDWTDDYRVERHAADIVELVDHLGLEGIHLAGMSLGGCAAGHAAPVLGGRLKSLTFIDVADEVSFAATARMRAFIAGVRPVPDIADLVRQALEVSPLTDPDLMAHRYQHLLKPGPEGFVWKADRRRPTDFAAILAKVSELRNVAPRISCPVLVVKGGRSRVLSQPWLERFAGRFADGSWIVVPDAGHNVQEDQPVRLAAALRELITRVDVRDTRSRSNLHSMRRGEEQPMSLASRFMAQRGVFEQAYVNGDWRALAPFFHDDILYEVMNMPFHCAIRGRDAFLAGLQRSVERFDKLCIRTVGIDPSVREEGDNVIVYSGMRFERPGAPPVTSRVWEIATYRDGRIARMVDLYDVGSAEEFARWMDDWGEGLDPSYV